MRSTDEGRLLHIRSLNHLAREHKLTYVGARILAESIHPSIIDEWSDEYMSRKLRTSRRQVYWKHSLFKGFDDAGKPEYRKCVIGSPTTHLTEAWLLKRLARDTAFALHPSVYSYFWGSEHSNNIYKYYFNGYVERENRIADAATKSSDSCVLIFDLKGFYPSIDVSTLRGRFAGRLMRSGLSTSEREIAIQCVDELTSIKNEKGLPIGPALSHALANVFLEDFDHHLSDQFGDNYFRYVDDVAIVVPRSHIDSARSFFEQVVRDQKLKLHPDKKDILAGADWATRIKHREQAGTDSFGLLLSDLRRYLAHNLDDYDQVRSMFQDEGFTLPFSRLRSVASSSKSFRRFLQRLWSKSNEFLGSNISRPPALLERARHLRQYFHRRLIEATERELPPDGMNRRWSLQEIRYHLNRSLYLFPPDARKALLTLLPDCHELVPSRTVLESLITGDASELTKYPGPTVSSFCELWTETTDRQPILDWSPVPSKEERDGASGLALYGLAEPPEGWIQQLREPSSRVMVKLATGQPSCLRSFDDFSYIDEMESLFLKPNVNVNRMLHSRFDDGEDVFLPTLSLGGGQSMT